MAAGMKLLSMITKEAKLDQVPDFVVQVRTDKKRPA
jgi:hypothetical protein